MPVKRDDLVNASSCQVTVDAEQSIAVVQGGAKLENLDAACAPYGLAVTAGTNPDTGVGGLTLGGGVGLLARRFGMTIDNLVAVKMVLADGQVVGADENMNPDLFWAVRGGGGNFGTICASSCRFAIRLSIVRRTGVVLEFRFRLHKIGNQGRVVAGNMVYLRPWILRPVMEYPPTAMRLHRDYWLEMPPEMGALAVVVSQGPFVAMYCYSGDVDEGKRIAGDKLSTLGRTFINTAGNEVSYHLEAQRLALGPDGKGQQPGYHYEVDDERRSRQMQSWLTRVPRNPFWWTRSRTTFSISSGSNPLWDRTYQVVDDGASNGGT